MENRGLGVGSSVYLVCLNISCHSNILFGIFVELERKTDTQFMVKKIINGNYFKVGDVIEIDDSLRTKFRSWNLFINYEDGLEYWNSRLRNAEDRLTSEYEGKRKKLLKRIIK